MRSALVKKSKFLSLVLRHNPQAAGVMLDANGWVSVSDLLAGAAVTNVHISMEDLVEIVETNEKRRFALSEDQTRIRASQGHSITVDLELFPAEPPEILFHGTGAQNRAAIVREGLRKMKRQHVHLSPDPETARRVGMRHGTPIVFQIDAARMADGGVPFYRSANGVWLVDAVDPAYLSEESFTSR